MNRSQISALIGQMFQQGETVNNEHNYAFCQKVKSAVKKDGAGREDFLRRWVAAGGLNKMALEQRWKEARVLATCGKGIPGPWNSL